MSKEQIASEYTITEVLSDSRIVTEDHGVTRFWKSEPGQNSFICFCKIEEGNS